MINVKEPGSDRDMEIWRKAVMIKKRQRMLSDDKRTDRQNIAILAIQNCVTTQQTHLLFTI